MIKLYYQDYFQDLRLNEYSTFYRLIYMLKRLITVSIYPALSLHAIVQIQIIMSLVLLDLCFIGAFRPYTSRTQNNSELVNQISALLLTYFLACLQTDYLNEKGAEYVAIAASAVLCLNLMYHISKILRGTCHTCSKTIERKRLQIRRN